MFRRAKPEAAAAAARFRPSGMRLRDAPPNFAAGASNLTNPSVSRNKAATYPARGYRGLPRFCPHPLPLSQRRRILCSRRQTNARSSVFPRASGERKREGLFRGRESLLSVSFGGCIGPRDFGLPRYRSLRDRDAVLDPSPPFPRDASAES